MKTKIITMLVLAVIIIIAVISIILLKKPNQAVTPPTTGKENLIQVANIVPNQSIQSPLTITGQARGYWFFEASFPVKILDANGNVLGSTPAQAKGEWMTENFVPFEAKVTFTSPTTNTGTLVLQKDNPSGLPENADELRIPITFANVNTATRDVKLYFYNAEKDKDSTGNLICSKQGVEAVTRKIPITNTPIQDTIKLLLAGNPTAEEKSKGISTEFPLPGVELKSASNNNGVLTLTFADPNDRTGGGSCRIEILWAQIEATAKQFPEVKSVRFSPELLFQP
jgi:spore germination protein GerM